MNNYCDCNQTYHCDDMLNYYPVALSLSQLSVCLLYTEYSADYLAEAWGPLDSHHSALPQINNWKY